MLLAGVPFIPQLFLEYQQEEIQDRNALVNSGLMVTNDAIQAEFAKGGKTIDLPFFGDLSGDSEILDDVAGLTPSGPGWRPADRRAQCAWAGLERFRPGR
jgi:hypothetical protein